MFLARDGNRDCDGDWPFWPPANTQGLCRRSERRWRWRLGDLVVPSACVFERTGLQLAIGRLLSLALSRPPLGHVTSGESSTTGMRKWYILTNYAW